MKTERQSRNDNRETFMNSSVVVAAPMPLRLPVGSRVGRPLTDRVANARRLTGVAILRIAFGVIWAVDASLKWQPAFRANFQQLLSDLAKGQPGFLACWFALWPVVVSGRAPVFAILTAS